jgi:hypothetical protein
MLKTSSIMIIGSLIAMPAGAGPLLPADQKERYLEALEKA